MKPERIAVAVYWIVDPLRVGPDSLHAQATSSAETAETGLPLDGMGAPDLRKGLA